MFNSNLPQGEKVGLIKNINYNVPGIFLCADLLYLFIDMVEEKFGYKIPVKYIYGSPQLKWNGGRLILHHYNSRFSLHEIEKEIFNAHQRKIIPLVTLSNMNLKKEDLTDVKCNDILKLIRDFNAEVIVSSELLLEYIKEYYPMIGIHASVIKTAYHQNRDSHYYERLSKQYDHYVVHPDDNFNDALLKKLPKDNAEIIVNERCFYNCPMRSLHYDSISEEQITQTENSFQNKNFLRNCNAMPEYKQSYTRERNISLTASEMKQLHELGYDLFKIQGRTDELHLFFFDLMRYTLENELAFPHMYAVFSHQIDKFIRGGS